MKSIIVNENSQLDIIHVEIPEITQPDEVLIKIAYSGLCGSDIPRIFAKGAHFYPITLGHEFSGKVVAIGENVTHLSPDDKVASVPLLPCFACPECEHGYYSLCKQYDFVGSRRTGGFSEYIVVNAKNVYKLPNHVSLLEGAFFEPLTVGMHAILLADGCEDKNVVIIGAGTIGLLAMQCCKAMGAKSITVIDVNTSRLALALSLGADFVYNSAELSEQEIQQKLSESRFNQLILETAGVVPTVLLSIKIAGPRAKIILVGTLHHDLTLPSAVFGLILRKELTIIGSWMNYSAPWPGKEWQLVSQYCQDGAIELTPLIAGIGDFDEFIKLVGALHGKPMSGKLLLNITDD
ncbi:alcohol dehydrogenase catalytic domain-containing protein [Utexia brackfieldae]|uniref:alcohol dehydrogenase catalytic domain-containing protein n=1 Tax=Utexia brackfieldae TaxID=3074108 RepID=UPI00370DB7BB